MIFYNRCPLDQFTKDELSWVRMHFFLQFKKKDCILLYLGVGTFIYRLIFRVIQNQSLFFLLQPIFYKSLGIVTRLNRMSRTIFLNVQTKLKKKHFRKIVLFIPNVPTRRWSNVQANIYILSKPTFRTMITTKFLFLFQLS